jgi:hypothetical protein
MGRRKAKIGMKIAATVAVLFGALTIWSGGHVLFGGPEVKAAIGNTVSFVLWFNFGAGFVYIAAGAGLYLGRIWAAWLAVLIAVSTLIVFAAFGIHVINDGLYENQTVGAMALRSLVWIAIAVIAVRARIVRRTEIVS